MNKEYNREKTRRFRTKLRVTDPVKFRRLSKEHNWKQAGIYNADGTVFTIVDYDRLYQIQQGKCGICSRHQSELKESLCADHDHATGIIRGLLCHRCNSRINVLDGGDFTVKTLKYLKIKIVKEN